MNGVEKSRHQLELPHLGRTETVAGLAQIDPVLPITDVRKLPLHTRKSGHSE
jgi:hypothetical protein